MIRLLLCLTALNWLAGSTPAEGRQTAPRQYIPSAGTVSLARSMPFFQALQALSEISARLEGRVIVDDRERTFAIGVDIADMVWRDALDILVKLHGLQLQEYNTHVRVYRVESNDAAAEEVDRSRYTSARREVQISAIFFEGDRRKLRDTGINWGAAVKQGAWIHGVEHAVPGQVAVTLQPQQQQQSGASGGGSGEGEGGDKQISEGLLGLLRMLESRSVGQVLASPSIQVMDGDEGRVQVGQDFSIKQIDFAGNVTDNFISTGLILQVAPTVLQEDSLSFVHLSVTAERSSVAPGAVSTIVNKTQASTSLMLLDGERAVIAGLYSTTESKNRAGIPLLKDLPAWFFGIRYLAGTTVREASQKELIIILQAHLVSSLSSRRVDDSSGEDYLEGTRQRLRDSLPDLGKEGKSGM